MEGKSVRNKVEKLIILLILLSEENIYFIIYLHLHLLLLLFDFKIGELQDGEKNTNN